MLRLPPCEAMLPNCLDFQLVIFKLGLHLLKMPPIFFEEQFPAHRGVGVLFGKKTAYHSVRLVGFIKLVRPEKMRLLWHGFYLNVQQERKIFR